jgi:YidC/Oxa1 family membrane protein insertase
MLDIFYTIIIYPIVQIIEFVFVFVEKTFKATGISIIGVSVVVSFLCLPLYNVAEKWQQIERDTQKRLKSKIDKIKAVFKGDEQYMILSAYYRQNHYHPVYAMRSTFGLLIQIPFFIAAYSYLSHFEALNGASFLFIRDLGAPDALIPTQGGVNLLPVLMTLINCVSGAIYTRGLGVKDKIQIYGTALVFLALFYNSPSGLVLYWTLNNVFSLAKNSYYKITYKYKFKIMMLMFSAVCVFLSVYIIAVHTGNFNLRLLLTASFLAADCLPWITPLARKSFAFFPVIKYCGMASSVNFFISFSALWVLTGFFLPSQLIASSPLEFSYIDTYTTPLFFIANTAIQSFGLFVFWTSCLFFLFSQNIKAIFTVAAPILLIFAICNVFLFPGNYGIISVDLVYNSSISHSRTDSIYNLAVLLVVFLFITILYFSGRQKFVTIGALLCLFSAAGLSAFNLFSIQAGYVASQEYHRDSAAELTETTPIFNV